MNPITLRSHARRPVAAAVVVAFISTLAGCQSGPPAVDLNSSAEAVAGIADAIVFRSEGEPVDLPHAASDLTVASVIEEAIRHDPEVQIRLARVRAALGDARQARLLPNPVLSVVLRFPEGGATPEIEAGLAADLLSLLQTPRKTSAADHRLRAASADVLIAVLDALSAAQEGLIAAQAAEAEEAVIVQRGQLVARLLELAKARVEAGEASRLDVLVLDVERVESDAELIELRARRAKRRMNLALLLGQPSSTTQWGLPPLDDEAASAYPERDLIEAALLHRPEIDVVQWELAALGDDAAMSRAWWVEGGSVGIEAERDGDWAVGPGASLPLPLFDWGHARREKADARVVEARHRLTQVSRQVIAEVRQAAATLSASTELFAKVRSELLPLAERRHEQAEAQYRSGEANVTMLLQAEQRLLSARSKLIQAQQDMRQAEVRLQRAVGRRTLPTR